MLLFATKNRGQNCIVWNFDPEKASQNKVVEGMFWDVVKGPLAGRIGAGEKYLQQLRRNGVRI